MTLPQTILQCLVCARLFQDRVAGRVLISAPVNLGQLFIAGAILEIECGWPDCAAVKKKNETRPQFKRPRQIAAANHGRQLVRECRSPLPPENDGQFQQSVEVPGLLCPGARQEKFIASGATSETDALVRDFLLLPHNFGNWFSRKFLKGIARNDLLNNIADRLRDELIPKGFYVDQQNMRESELARATSHYRICRIDEAISLTKEEKLKLMENA